MSLLGQFVRAFRSPSARFRDSMKQIASELRVELLGCGNSGDACCLRIPAGRHSYLFFLVGVGDEIRLSVHSRFGFDQLPQDILAFLKARNREIPYADWDVWHFEGEVFFSLKSAMLFSELSTASVLHATHRLVADVGALDQLLVEEGYA